MGILMADGPPPPVGESASYENSLLCHFSRGETFSQMGITRGGAAAVWSLIEVKSFHLTHSLDKPIISL